MKLTTTNFDLLKLNYSNYISNLTLLCNDFGGPSIHFHVRSLEERNRNFLKDSHLENIYATLSAWGMHRMGKTLTKMVDYATFKNSILSQKEKIVQLKDYRIENLGNQESQIICEISKICFAFKVSVSDSKIVGNSKTLAHILPDLVPPIDRQHTIRFFCHEPHSIDKQKGLFKTLSNFRDFEEPEIFAYILNKANDFVNHIKDDKRIVLDNQFNTSYPKVFDNLIMAYIKSEKDS